MLQIIVLIYGFYALLKGEFQLFMKERIYNREARIAGAILLLNIPISFGVGLLLGVLVGMGILPEAVFDSSILMEVSILVGMVLLARPYAMRVSKMQVDLAIGTGRE